MAVSVKRLIHRGAADNVVRDRIALEDALNTALPQDGRLVLVRKLAVRGEVASPRQRQVAVRRGWIDAVAGAVHATSPFAVPSNCVWFASPAEAEAILLRKLLAGEPIVGWFWVLAIPDWRNLALGDWLPRRIGECLRERDDATLTRIAQACVEAGRVPALIEAAARTLRLAPDRPAAAPGQPPLSGRSTPDRARTARPREALIAAAVRRLPPSLLSPAWIDMLARIESPGAPIAASRDLVLAIVREKVRRASPALALDPRLLNDVAEAAWDQAPGGLAPLLAEPAAPGDTSAPAGGEAADRSRAISRGTQVQRYTREGRALTHSPPVTEPEARPKLAEAPEAPAERPHELASRHAGLWLVVPSLIRLGFREWLAERPELLGEDPGRRLILAIALHHRVPRTDPALAMLDIQGDGEDAPDWIEAWRAGLDRWLRRTARRRTHDLVARPGWIALGDDRLDIRYPLDAADLRLRRLALDSNAGWTDWLGLSLWFHFGGNGAK